LNKTKKKRRTPLIYKIIAIMIFLIAIDCSYYFFVIDIKKLLIQNPGKTAFMNYREKQWKVKGKNKKIIQKWVPLRSISKEIRNAVIISEDAKFWTHNGFDYNAIYHAFRLNIKKKQFAYGASTISQQLVKNLYLSPAKNPLRKLNEAILTWRIERILPKNRILEIYLNVIEWGDGIYGIEAASRYYFKHSAESIDKKEAALLAAVIPNPIKFNPMVRSKYITKRVNLIRKALGGDVSATNDLHSKSIRGTLGLDIRDTVSAEIPDKKCDSTAFSSIGNHQVTRSDDSIYNEL
jgi:monofunctional biosynthetic peptidoglycan transglycosylase